MLVVASIAAIPGLIHAVFGGALLVDDFSFLNKDWAAWGQSIDRHSRPFQWVIHLVQFELLGGRAWAHALLMAAGNAAVAVLIARAVAANVSTRLAAPTAVLWALYPASTSVRYWYSTAPLLFAIGCLAAAWERHRRPGLDWSTTVLAACSILAYESGIVLAFTVALWPLARRRRADGLAAAHLAVLFGVTALNRLTSPKGAADFDPWSSILKLPTALVGPSLMPSAVQSLSALIMALPLAAVALRVTRGPSPHDRAMAVGVALAAAGMVVMVGIGFPLVPGGLLDRGNAMAAPGLALLFAASVAAIGHHLETRAAMAAAALVVVGFALSTIETGVAVRQASDDLELAFEAAAPLDGEVVIDLPTRLGYAAVTLSWSVEAAATYLAPGLEASSADDRDPLEADWLVTVADDGAVEVTRPG